MIHKVVKKFSCGPEEGIGLVERKTLLCCESEELARRP